MLFIVTYNTHTTLKKGNHKISFLLINTLMFKIFLGIFPTLSSFIVTIVITSTKGLTTVTEKHLQRLLTTGKPLLPV